MYSIVNRKVLVLLHHVEEKMVLMVENFDLIGVLFRDASNTHSYIPFTSIVMLIDQEEYTKANPEGKE
jgi:hypothetical protein